MTKAKAKQAAEAKKSPLRAFVDHQVTALEETGKAIGSLFPEEFRDHTGKAFKETKEGFSALLDGVIDTVESGLDKLRCASKEEESGKVKVEVD